MKQMLPLLAGLLLTLSASAKIWTIQAANFAFTPSSVPTVTVGDTIQWVWVNGAHTTTSTSVPPGAATWDSPLETTTPTFKYKTTVEGVYIFQCTPHAPNMSGTFTVQKATAVPEINTRAVLSYSPNPVNNNLHIAAPGGFNPNQILIIDRLGRTILSVSTNTPSSMDIPTANLANGLYMLKASGAGKSFSSMFVVQH